MTQAAADLLVAEGQHLFLAQRFVEAAGRFERAVSLFPTHALGWKGLGHALLCMGRAYDAARAFDQAIGLRPESATALWGGALAHADVGNKIVASSYLRRAIALQPTWIAMAQGVAQLAPFLQVSVRAGELLQRVFGPFSKRTYRHATDERNNLEVGRIANQPKYGRWTYVTVGLANAEWNEPERPRIELVLASTIDNDICAQILANLGFHLAATGFYPQPGTMVRDVVSALSAGELSQRLPHVYVQAPREWGLSLPLDIGPPAVTLAQVFPISEAEYQMWRALGADRFEHSLADRKIDVGDLRRLGT